MKNEGTIVKNWQFHTLHEDVKAVNEAYGVNITTDKVYVFTGTVVKDPTGRFDEGWHMRSSAVLSFDPETGRCETQNSIYTLEGPEGDPTFDNQDMGTFVMRIFY